MIAGSLRLGFPSELFCEVLIVGSGAGGSAVAEVLTRAGRDVLMIEEGPQAGPGEAATSPSEGMRRFWRGGGLTLALGSVPISYAEGRCVGGGTEINSGIMQRAPTHLLDDWAKTYAIDEFSAFKLAPYYDRALSAVNASLTPGDLGENSEILRRGADALGWKVTALERAQRHCVGTNMCSSVCPTGGKQSMSVTLLPEALKRGMRLVSDCRIDKLTVHSGRVIGAVAVTTDHLGRRWPLRIHAQQVFVCAGAIHTPALLRRSGVTGNIGNTLRMHPTVKLLGRFADRVGAHESRLPLYAVTEFMPDIRLGGSVFVPGSFGLSIAENWDQRAHMISEMAHSVVYYSMVRGQGVGTIRNIPGASEPLVRYSPAEADWENLASGAMHLGELMFAAGATEVFPPHSSSPGWKSRRDISVDFSAKVHRRRASVISIHLFSSCPPGENSQSATDSFGRVRGFENLAIADASQIPEAPGVNPQATVMALAYRSAEAWLAHSAKALRLDAAKELAA